MPKGQISTEKNFDPLKLQAAPRVNPEGWWHLHHVITHAVLFFGATPALLRGSKFHAQAFIVSPSDLAGSAEQTRIKDQLKIFRH